MGKEIERKWMLQKKPEWADRYPGREIIQGYICTKPVVRIRRDGDEFYLTVKGNGKVSREEVNLPVEEDTFHDLCSKCSGNMIEKRRYVIPITGEGRRLEPGEAGTYHAELDVFEGAQAGRIYLEVEFETEEEALNFQAPEWFETEVTGLEGYSNAALSRISV